MIGDSLRINYMTIMLHFRGIIGDSLKINYMTTILDILASTMGRALQCKLPNVTAACNVS